MPEREYTGQAKKVDSRENVLVVSKRIIGMVVCI
jgi:hypothetical protein